MLAIMYFVQCVTNPSIGICLLVKSQKRINYFIKTKIYSFGMVILDFYVYVAPNFIERYLVYTELRCVEM
jgi:hypothetical protein